MKREPTEIASDAIQRFVSDAKFKALVIMMITEMVEYGCKIEEKVEVYTK